MTTQTIGVKCPFTFQDNLPIPDLPVNKDCWYGKVPETPETERVNIWYFNKSVVEIKGWVWIVKNLVNPNGGSFTDIVLRCGKIAENLYEKGHIVQIGDWFFFQIGKNPVFFF